jgi:hypothetical protein
MSENISVPVTSKRVSFCRMCGNNLQGLSEDACFCPKCGANIEPVQAPKVIQEHVPNAQTSGQSSAVMPPVSAPAPTAARPVADEAPAASLVNPIEKKSGSLQDINLAELKPIELGGFKWRVIKYDAEEDTMLLLSETVIDKIPFQARDDAYTWEKSSLRAYLNADFLKRFTEEEQTFIIPTWLENKGEAFTEDKIFLLSVDEAKEVESAIDLLAKSSAGGNVAYWLRTKGMQQGMRAYISSGGGIAEMGYDAASNNYMGVRPAMWVSASFSEALDAVRTAAEENRRRQEEENHIHEYVASMESLIASNKKEILRLRASGDHTTADALFTETKSKENELAYLRPDVEKSTVKSALNQKQNESVPRSGDHPISVPTPNKSSDSDDNKSLAVKCFIGAAAVFIIASMIQAAGGSHMFELMYYEPESKLLSVLMKISWWPGWIITGGLIIRGIAALAGSNNK